MVLHGQGHCNPTQRRTTLRIAGSRDCGRRCRFIKRLCTLRSKRRNHAGQRERRIHACERHRIGDRAVQRIDSRLVLIRTHRMEHPRRSIREARRLRMLRPASSTSGSPQYPHMERNHRRSPASTRRSDSHRCLYKTVPPLLAGIVLRGRRGAVPHGLWNVVQQREKPSVLS